MGKVEAVCISEKKGVPKREVKQIQLRQDWGIVNDAHAGQWIRQVSLLPGESVDGVRRQIHDLYNGAFAENIITRGFALNEVQVGDQLRIGNDVLLEVTQIGKKCHSACVIQKITGDCIMPKQGVFAKVLRGGYIQADDSIELKRLISQVSA